MPIYRYQAKKGAEEIIEGAVSARSQEEAIEKISRQGLFPVEVALEEQTAADKSPAAKSTYASAIKNAGSLFRRGIGSSEVLVFTQKLTTLMRAKIDLLTALNILYEQTDDESFKEIIKKIYNQVKKGTHLSAALKEHSKVFGPLFIAVVKAGEASGKMDEALGSILDYMRRRQVLKNRVRGALVYPAVLLTVGIVSIFLILTFVVPRLKAMFLDLGADIPLITRLILNASDFMVVYWHWVLLGAAVLILILMATTGSRLLVRAGVSIIKAVPLTRRLIKNQELTNFSRSFSLLIQSGVAPLESLEISAGTVSEPQMQQDLERAAQDIREGKTISKSLEGFKTMPNFFKSMVAIGEESGRLQETLDEIAASYTQEIESDISIITSILEPVLILIIGVILGVIIISILLPVFQVSQMIS